MFHFLLMILLPPSLIAPRIMTFNHGTFPKKRLPPNDLPRRKNTLRKKARTRVRTLTRAIAGKSTIAISTGTGLGNTANEERHPETGY
jgi:hypothetical protein